MKSYLFALKQSQLFSGVKEEEVEAMCSCLSAVARSYEKGDYVVRQGDAMNHIMILAEGELHIQRDDYWGNRSILNRIRVGEMFGEAYLGPESSESFHDVLAARDSVVICFDVARILTTCSSACRFHAMVLKNLFFAISAKNRSLVHKLGHMAKRTTRDKLISYLSEQAREQKSSTFVIPFNRQQLADFLSIDRSAMSKELCKMRDEGLIRFDKSRFTLLSGAVEL